MYLGSFIIDDTCTLYCNAHTPSTGAAVDADAAPGYRIYEDETGTPILTGSYALLDDANTLGFYSEQITLSAANGFEAGKSYSVRTTIVVGGVTGVQLDRLQIGARVDARLWLGTAIATPATAGIPDVNIKNMNNVAATPITTVKAVQGLAVDGVVPTVTNLTNAPTAGDLTATMKTSVTTAATAATPVAASVTGNVGGNVAGSVGSVVGTVGSVTAAVTLTAGERTAIADAWTARNIAGGSSAGRTNGEAMATLRNKCVIAAGVLTVYAADDVTPLFTAAITTAAGNPISEIDPA